MYVLAIHQREREHVYRYQKQVSHNFVNYILTLLAQGDAQSTGKTDLLEQAWETSLCPGWP